MEAHLAKYRSLIPSLALILHLLDDGKPEVTLTALERAIAWGEYLESHARRIYTSVTASADLAARAIGQKLLDGELETQFAARDVYRKAWAGLTDKDVVHGGLDVLVSRKWLEERVQEPGGRRATVYVVNPRLTASVAAEQPTEPTEEASVSFVGAAFGAPDYDGDNAANINNPTSNHNRR